MPVGEYINIYIYIAETKSYRGYYFCFYDGIEERENIDKKHI